MDITKYTDLNKSLNASESELYQEIAGKCAEEFSISISESLEIIQKSANDLSTATHQISLCDDTITKVIASAKQMKTDVDSTYLSINEIKNALSEANEVISCESDSIKESVSSIEKAVDNSKMYLLTMEELSQKCLSAADSSLNSLCQLQNTINDSINIIQESTKKYSLLLDDINTKLQNKFDNMSCGIDDLKQSVDMMNVTINKLMKFGGVIAGALLIVELVNIFI